MSVRRPRILFLTHRLPYAPNRGDRLRAYQTLRVLQQLADVHVVSLVHDDEEASHAADMQGVASSVRLARVRHWLNRARAIPALLTSTPLTHVLLHSGDMTRQIRKVLAEAEPDLVFAFCSGVAHHGLDARVSGIPMILDMVDVDSAKWASLASTRPWWHPLRFVFARESRLLARFEARATRHARATTVISERERTLLMQLAPGTMVQVVEIAVDCDRLRPPDPPPAEPTVVFCGVMNYEPNEQGMLWFIEHVWPLIRTERSDAKLQVVGSNPTRRLVEAAAAAVGVVVTGSVPRVEPFLWQSAVSVAPLFVAHGMQTKVIEAIAAGLPVVLTPQVAAGLPPVVLPACVEATRPDEFARAVLQLLALTPEQRRARASEADLATLTGARAVQPLVEIVRAVLGRE